MKIRALFLSCALLAAAPLYARSKTDVLIMKNGDRLTCEVKRLEGGVLSVGLDYVDGTTKVDWSKVARLESAQLFVVRTQDGSLYEGIPKSAETAGGQAAEIQIKEMEGHSVKLQSSKIVAINQTSNRLLQQFNGAINFGVNYSKGNEATQYNLGTDLQYLRTRWGTEAALNSNLAANSGSTTSTRNQLDLRGYHLLPWNNYFYEGLGSFLQSSVQGITLQTTLGGGIGRFLKSTNRANIAVLGGMGWQSTNYQSSSTVPQNTQNVAAALIGAQVKLFQFSKSNLSATAIVLPALSDPGRVRFNTNETYYLKIIGDISWNLSFYGNWDNRPPDGFSGSDYGASSGLSWSFGNR